MFGNNPKRKPVNGSGDSLDIQSIFRTFQGEGIFVGYPSVFVRLGGCNLDCSFCDTEFENFSNKSIDQIIDQVNLLSGESNNYKTHNLIVITGGEPFRQPIEKLCDQLINLGYIVQIETNGTIFRDVHSDVKIICSPKNTNGFHIIRDDLLKRIDALKFIISASDNKYNYVGDVGQKKYNTKIYVQPMDEYDKVKNKANIEYVKKLADKEGYIICLQTHKILEIE